VTACASMKRADLRLLVCPKCRSGLEFRGELLFDELATGTLRCEKSAHEWPFDDELAKLMEDEAIHGLEGFMRCLYDTFAVLHDQLTRVVVPLMQFETESATRDAYMRRIDLTNIATRRRRGPLRVLEIGVGTGANLPLIERDLPRGLDVEIWGLDFSRGMLEQCRRRPPLASGRRVRLLLADAHALPFPDSTFDRVFHVGGIASFRDPRLALAEMARVARPETPIVVVDERLDPERRHCLYHRLMFRALTFYDPAPASPRPFLPKDAQNVIDEQASRFFYCLTFSVPR